ncbi:hypothetical protein GCM10009747_30700 [Agromyces humatus]|uniref:Glycosyltransferase RgtA/B/C/D-like domain-containing protein n=2 Tax=Agromyces humatus TaxID=279573 RepID=A0ABP4X4L5_9MICO
MLSVAWPVALLVAVAGAVRFVGLDAVGFNSDEAVYAGTAASLAGDRSLEQFFPVFRAHPVLFQTLVAGVEQTLGADSDWVARAVAAVVGIAAVLVTFALGRRLYGHGAGLIAGLFLAVMPYHVVVSRQVLLDGLMTLFVTVALSCIVRYAESGRAAWMFAAGSAMGLAFLAKETAVVVLGGLFAFFALTPWVTVRLRHVVAGLVPFAVLAAVHPLSQALAGKATAGSNYLVYQLFRPENHPMTFYASVVPWAVGILVLAAAIVGLVWLRRESTWRERLLLCWAGFPIVFFTIWPVRGYQYLLPIAPVVAVLAGRTVSRLVTLRALQGRRRAARAAVIAVATILAVSLAIPTAQQISPSSTGSFLAGTGGVPGGREAGQWVAEEVPANAHLLTIGPSMANILQYYGHRKVYGLSVSPNPEVRNPTYTPVRNPDRALRRGELQYLVWDSYSAGRSPSFSAKLRSLVDKYNGVPVYSGIVGSGTKEPVIVIYAVWPDP